MANPLLDMLVESIGNGVTRQNRIPVFPDANMSSLGEYRYNPNSSVAGNIFLNPNHPKMQKLGDINKIIRHEELHNILQNYQNHKRTPIEEYVFRYHSGDPQREAPAYMFSTTKNPFDNYNSDNLNFKDYRSGFLKDVPPDIMQKILKLYGRAARSEE